MEIRREKSVQGCSDISYMKLENSSHLKIINETNFTVQQTFLKNLIKINVTNQNENDSSINYENDEGFLSQLFLIVEKHEKKASASNQSRNIDEQTYQKIHQLCNRHYEANKFNSYSDFEPSKIPQEMKCKCGCLKSEGEPLLIWTDQSQHYFFGPIIILYFFYLRRILILLISIALIYSLYAVSTNVILAPDNIAETCEQKPGMLSFLCPIKYTVSTFNKLSNEKYMTIQVWLGFVFCVVWLIALRVIRSMGRALNQKIDRFLDSSSDYVIQIDNLPIGKYTENQIIKYITTLWKGFKSTNSKPLAIKSVQIIYKMDEARKMMQKIISNAKTLASNLEKIQSKGKVYYKIKEGKLETYLNNKMELIRSMLLIEQYRQRFANDQEFRQTLASDIALVQFEDPQDKTDFLKEVKQYRVSLLGEFKQLIMSKLFNSDQNYVFKGNRIRITRAPEPSDINWKNCEKKNSYKLVALVWLIVFTIVCISFGFLTFIRILRQQFKVLSNFSILVSISLQTFNRIIWNTLLYTIKIQENNTSTENVISTLNKGAFAQIINIIVLPIIFNFAMKKNLTGSEGMVGSTMDYHFTFFLMQIFLNVINVPYQAKRLSIRIPFIRKYFIRKYAQLSGSRFHSFQEIKQVLSYYEPPSFSVASNFISLNTIIFQTMFFIHMQPALIFFLIFNLMSIYLIQKYLLLRRSKIPELFDFIIFETSCSYLQHVPLIYGLGSTMFMTILGTGGNKLNYIPSFLCLGIWLINLIDPFSILKRFIKYIASCLLKVDEEQVIEIKQSQKTNEKMAASINDNLNEKEDVVYKRKQCYYSKCGTNQLLQYESTLTQVKKTDEYESLNKLFCQKFSVKVNGQKKNHRSSIRKQNIQISNRMSHKLLPRIKQSFALVKDPSQLCNIMLVSTKTNKIMPIDMLKFPDELYIEELSQCQLQKQNQNLEGYCLKYNKKRRKAKQEIQDTQITKNRLVLKSLNQN